MELLLLSNGAKMVSNLPPPSALLSLLLDFKLVYFLSIDEIYFFEC